MTNRERCDYLKSVRKTVADKLGIDLHQRKCTFEGECSGTCPKCKSEETILNNALLKGVAVAGAMVVLASCITACTPVKEDLSGDVEMAPPTEDLSGDVEVSDPNAVDGEMITPDDVLAKDENL